MAVSFRMANSRDATEIAHVVVQANFDRRTWLVEELVNETFSGHPPEGWSPDDPDIRQECTRQEMNTWTFSILRSPDTRVMVAEILKDGDRDIIGALRMEIHDREAHIIHLAVHPNVWGHGIGSELRRQALLQAIEEGCVVARLMNRGGARGFYEKFGWAEVEGSEELVLELTPERVALLEAEQSRVDPAVGGPDYGVQFT